MVETATVTSKGQVTLPASIRRKYRIREGSQLLFLEDEGGLRVLTEEDVQQLFRDVDRARRELGLRRKDVEAWVDEAKDRIWRTHYAGRR